MIQPVCTLEIDSFLSCVEYCPTDANTVAGGCENGIIALWDVRKGGKPEKMTFLDSHCAPVYGIKWIRSECGSEFLSVSTDSKVISWDARNLSKPMQVLYLDPNKLEEAKDIPLLNRIYGITCVHYDFSLPFRFMLGTEQGTVFSCNRRPKSPGDLIPGIYNTKMRPILALDKNPYFIKHFAAVGPWGVEIWCEDLKDSPLLTLSSSTDYVTDGIWSSMRPSVLFITKETGDFEIWDLLSSYTEHTVSVKLENGGLNCVRCNERGDRIAVGTLSGSVHLIEMGQSFQGISENEKNILASMLGRDGKHTKPLKGNTRKQRMKQVARQEMIEDIAKRKMNQVKASPQFLAEYKDQYSHYLEFEEKLFSEEERKKFYSEIAKPFNVEMERGEKELMEQLSREAEASAALQYAMDTVSQKTEEEISSHFPLIKMEIPEEYGEEKFVDQLDEETDKESDKDPDKESDKESDEESECAET